MKLLPVAPVIGGIAAKIAPAFPECSATDPFRALQAGTV